MVNVLFTAPQYVYQYNVIFCITLQTHEGFKWLNSARGWCLYIAAQRIRRQNWRDVLTPGKTELLSGYRKNSSTPTAAYRIGPLKASQVTAKAWPTWIDRDIQSSQIGRRTSRPLLGSNTVNNCWAEARLEKDCFDCSFTLKVIFHRHNDHW